MPTSDCATQTARGAYGRAGSRQQINRLTRISASTSKLAQSAVGTNTRRHIGGTQRLNAIRRGSAPGRCASARNRARLEGQYSGLRCRQSLAPTRSWDLPVARCTAERLMRRQSLRGVMRGKVVRATRRQAACDRACRRLHLRRPAARACRPLSAQAHLASGDWRHLRQCRRHGCGVVLRLRLLRLVRCALSESASLALTPPTLDANTSRCSAKK